MSAQETVVKSVAREFGAERKAKIFLFCNTLGCGGGLMGGKGHDIQALCEDGEWLEEHTCSHGACDLNDEFPHPRRAFEKHCGVNGFELVWDNYDKPSSEFATALKLAGE